MKQMSFADAEYAGKRKHRVTGHAICLVEPLDGAKTVVENGGTASVM